MNVADLKAELDKYPDDFNVVVDTDHWPEVYKVVDDETDTGVCVVLYLSH